MKKWWRFLLLILIGEMNVGHLAGQSLQQTVLNRLPQLSYHNALQQLVTVEGSGIKIFPSATAKKQGKPEFTLYWTEVPAFCNLIKQLPTDSVIRIYEKKKNSDYTKIWNSAYGLRKKQTEINGSGSLQGLKIALDPGHMAGDFETGKIEQKFLEFRAGDTTGLNEDVKLVEGMLTWQTATIIKSALEEKGATVFITRKDMSCTSFGISYEEWFTKRKKNVLDSLFQLKKITAAEYKKYKSCSKEKLFWDFFRDFDLANRIRTINNFKPDLSVVIHYNVDEKNKDWLKPGPKNFSMCFIGGAMTADNFSKTIHKINFLRLLVSDDFYLSEKISGLTVNEFSKRLQVPVAGKKDATYLEENCNPTSTEGVYCRNLALCRGINSPLVYGECLYQDNYNECLKLNKCDKVYCGIKTSERVKEVADCYINAISNYFRQINSIK